MGQRIYFQPVNMDRDEMPLVTLNAAKPRYEPKDPNWETYLELSPIELDSGVIVEDTADYMATWMTAAGGGARSNVVHVKFPGNPPLPSRAAKRFGKRFM